MSILRLHSGLKFSFENDSARKNAFLSVCRCLETRFSLPEMDQKFIFGGTIGYGDSYLEPVVCRSKVFRLYTILHDGAAAVRSHGVKVPGYCRTIGREPISWLLGNVTGVLLLIHLKVFLPSTATFEAVCFQL